MKQLDVFLQKHAKQVLISGGGGQGPLGHSTLSICSFKYLTAYP